MWAAEVALEPRGGGERDGDGVNRWGNILGDGGWGLGIKDSICHGFGMS